ncbi:hypothetical protein GF354_01150 [Candidatus Peregrinibacteria bacterium]|nr:hypothetical protein [Candidatus Peregrinibacteria bacterium]
MQNLVIFGSTGSLGKSLVEVLPQYKDVKVRALTAFSNKNLLYDQGKNFNLGMDNLFLGELNGLPLNNVDIVANFLPGTIGIKVLETAIEKGIKVLLGNKESIVALGNIFGNSPLIYPVDSEHNAIYEIIASNPGKKIKKIVIPCSGGPFWQKPLSELKNISPKEALLHPKWKMGAKISLESALLINKGFEIIEAKYLFNLPLEKIEVLIHPDCIIHGMVYFEDEDLPYAYIAEPDMKEHIENALLRAMDLVPPKRNIKQINPSSYNLFDLDNTELRGIEIVVENFKKNPGNMLNFLEREEAAIKSFLSEQISFLDIYDKLK